MKTIIIAIMTIVIVFTGSICLYQRSIINEQNNRIQLADGTIDMLYRMLLTAGVIEDVDGILNENELGE